MKLCAKLRGFLSGTIWQHSWLMNNRVFPHAIEASHTSTHLPVDLTGWRAFLCDREQAADTSVARNREKRSRFTILVLQEPVVTTRTMGFLNLMKRFPVSLVSPTVTRSPVTNSRRPVTFPLRRWRVFCIKTCIILESPRFETDWTCHAGFC